MDESIENDEAFETWVSYMERLREENREEQLIKPYEEENKIHLGGE